MVKKQLLKNYCLSLSAEKIQLTLGILGLSDRRTKKPTSFHPNDKGRILIDIMLSLYYYC